MGSPSLPKALNFSSLLMSHTRYKHFIFLSVSILLNLFDTAIILFVFYFVRRGMFFWQNNVQSPSMANIKGLYMYIHAISIGSHGERALFCKSIWSSFHLLAKTWTKAGKTKDAEMKIELPVKKTRGNIGFSVENIKLHRICLLQTAFWSC